MNFQPHDVLQSVKLLIPKRHADERGFLSEIWREEDVREADAPIQFVQDNHCFTRAAGTVRGLHFQVGNAAQRKLVRCIRGSILDIVVDIRRASPTYGRHTSVVLSAENWRQLYVPVGFAHGYCTLEPDTELIYKVSSYW